MNLLKALLIILPAITSLTVAHPNEELAYRKPTCPRDNCQKALTSADPTTYASRFCRSVLEGPVASTTTLVTVRRTVIRKNTLIRTISVTKIALTTTTKTQTRTSSVVTEIEETATRLETLTSTPKTTITLDPFTEVVTEVSTTQKDVTDTQETTEFQPSTTTLTEHSTLIKTSTLTTTDTVVQGELETLYSSTSTTLRPVEHTTLTRTQDQDVTRTNTAVSTQTETQIRTLTSDTKYTTSTVTLSASSTYVDKKKRQAAATIPYASFTSTARSVCGSRRAILLRACSCYTFTVTKTTQVSEITKVTSETTTTVFPTTSTETSLFTTTLLETSKDARTLYTTKTETREAPTSTITESPTIQSTTTKYVDSTNLKTVYTTIVRTRTIFETETVVDVVQTTQTDGEVTSRTSTSFTTSEVVVTFVEPTTSSSTEVETRLNTIDTTTTQVETTVLYKSTTVDGPTSTRLETTTTTIGVNPTSLVENSGFESGNISPWTKSTYDSSTALDVASGAGLSGSYGVRWSRNSTSSYFFATMGLGLRSNAKGRLYHLQIHLRTMYAGCQIAWYNQRPDTQTQYSLFAFGSAYTERYWASGIWTSLSAFYVGDGPGPSPVRIEFYCPSGAPMGDLGHLDNVILLPQSRVVYDANTPPTGVNVVFRPNFEDGIFYPWQVSGTSAYNFESPSYNGAQYGLRLFLGAGVYSYVYQNQIMLNKGRVYLLSFAYKHDSVANFQNTVFTPYLVGASNGGADYFFPQMRGSDSRFPASGTWTRFSEPFAAPSSSCTLFLSWGNQGSAQQILHFSNITIIPVS